jgi:hypothetical protein
MPTSYTGLKSLTKWVQVLEQKKATDNLNENEMRELKYDLEQALQQFNDIVLKTH